jgi:phage gp45-like
MHRATPAAAAYRAYTGGGARSVVTEVDDAKFMQEMAGHFMAGEQRQAVEAPQNYGFTSVTADADKDGTGKITGSAETFISFMGGNRSFPVAAVIDDRRHRLYKLQKGDVAMFRQRNDQQQFHLTQDGGFWSAPDSKTVRMQLVPAQQQQQQGQGQQQGAQGGQQGGQQQRGQQSVYKDGQNGYQYVDVTKDKTTASGTNVHLKLKDKNTYVHVADDNNVYLGAEKGKAAFGRVETDAGTSVNVWAKIGGSELAEVDEAGEPLPESPVAKLFKIVNDLTERVATLEAKLEAQQALSHA